MRPAVGRFTVAMLLVSQSFALGQDVAICIGVDTYLDDSNIPPLQYASEDAIGLAQCLKNGGYSVHLFARHPSDASAGRAPTARNITQTLQTLAGQKSKIGTLIFAFSGRILRVPPNDLGKGGTPGSRVFLLAGDSRIPNADSFEEPDMEDGVESALSLAEVESLVRQIAPERAVLFLGGANARDRPDLSISPLAEPWPRSSPSVVTVYGCSERQFAHESDELRRGGFFHYVIEAIRGNADHLPMGNGDHKVTLSELLEFVQFSISEHDSLVERETPIDSQRLSTSGSLETEAPLFEVAAPHVFMPFSNSIGMQLVEIPSGEFLMGGLDPGAVEREVPNHELSVTRGVLHRVEITKRICFGQHEVTLEQFEKFVHDSGYKEADVAGQDSRQGFLPSENRIIWGREFDWRSSSFGLGKKMPVVYVSRKDANAFCQWLSEREGRPYRLPTNAEWEYACRGGSTHTRFSFGDEVSQLARHGNILDKSAEKLRLGPFDRPPWIVATAEDDGAPIASPVGKYLPNGFGLHDMHGNVAELCEDVVDLGFYSVSPIRDPVNRDVDSQPDTLRVCRGGSWMWGSFEAQCSTVGQAEERWRMLDIGFRVVLDLSEESEGE